MAVIKQGILGGFSGSVASVTGSSWKGIAVMKSKPLSVANPNTALQQAQRASFKAVALFGKLLLTYFIQAVYNPIAQRMSGYNFFVRQNKTAFDSSGNFVPANVRIGGGTLPNVANVTFAEMAFGKNFNIDFEAGAAPGSVRDTDKVYCFAYEPITGSFWINHTKQPRTTLGASLGIILEPVELSGVKDVYVGAVCVSADGRLVGVETGLYTLSIDFGA